MEDRSLIIHYHSFYIFTDKLHAWWTSDVLPHRGDEQLSKYCNGKDTITCQCSHRGAWRCKHNSNLFPRAVLRDGSLGPRFGRFTPEKTRCPLYKRVGGSRGRSGRHEKSPQMGFDPQTVYHVPSNYTDCDAPVAIKCSKATKQKLKSNVEQNKYVYGRITLRSIRVKWILQKA